MTSRERFEAWFMRDHPEMRASDATALFCRNAKGEYLSKRMQDVWAGYSAATADCRKIAQDMNCPQVAGAIGGE